MILTSPKTMSDNTIDSSINQLRKITTQQQLAITSIQTTLAHHQTILNTQQKDIADIKTSINHIIHSLSDLTTKLGLQITLPPPLPLSSASPTTLTTAAATSTIPSSPTDLTRPDSAPPALTPNPTPSYATGSGKTTAIGTSTLTPPPNFTQHFSSAEFESATNRFNEALLLAVSGFKKICIGVIDGGSMEVAIKRGSLMSDQICPDVYSFGIAPFEVLCVRQALDPTLPKEQEWADAHNMLVEMNKLRWESKVYIFDPGGIFGRLCVCDLEDKVVFKGSVMIRTQLHTTGPSGLWPKAYAAGNLLLHN